MLYPTGGRTNNTWFLSNNPDNDDQYDPDGSISSKGNGVFQMDESDYEQWRATASPRPNYPSEAIDGNDNDFGENVERGYAGTSNDWRNVEMTMYFKVSEWSDDSEEIVLKGPTGRHTDPEPDCQGYSYGSRIEMGDTPLSGFFKEMWHVNYDEMEEKEIPSSVHSGSFVDGKWHGVKYVRYDLDADNQPTIDRTKAVKVKLEHWIDDNGDGTGFVKVNETIDDGGWGSGGDDCGGDDDQRGLWGSIEMLWRVDVQTDMQFKWKSVREINVGSDFDDNPGGGGDGGDGDGDGGGNGGGGGGGGTSILTPVLTYCVVVTDPSKYLSNRIEGWTLLGNLMTTIEEELVESQVDPDPNGEFGDAGWQRTDLNQPDIGDEPCDFGDIDNFQIYPDGLMAEAYWSERIQKCNTPGLPKGHGGDSTGTIKYNGGRVMKTPTVNLIFWGSDWNTRTETPTRDEIITDVRDKLLGTDKEYFDDLAQYGGCGVPVWGTSVNNTAFPYPAGNIIRPEDGEKCLENTLETGLLPVTNVDFDNTFYIVIAEFGRELISPIGEDPVNISGWHSIFRPTIDLPSGGGGGGGGGAANPCDDFFGGGSGTVTSSSAAVIGSKDSEGIQWLVATGAITDVKQSRDEPNDKRWSEVFDDAGVGYECTWIINCHDITSDGHTALKCGGPNHTAPCGDTEEDNACCCWYDIGLRANGDIQTQIERPHPNNSDFDCPECTMSNIGMELESNWIGLKILIYPIKPGGTADDGGIKLKFWVSTNALVDGRPRNNWELVFDITDTGQILGDYEFPMEQEIEVRNSDTDNTSLYGDGVWVRKLVMPDDITHTGGGGPVTPPTDSGDCGADPGTGPGPDIVTKIQGLLKLQRDINIERTSPCGGVPGGGGGGGGSSGGSSVFYEVTTTSNTKELCDNSEEQNRTIIAQRIHATSSTIRGKIIHQFDIKLRKKGSPDSADKVRAKIWNSGDNIVYTSPTIIDPSLLSSSFDYVEFDFSTNNHVMVVGDYVGVEYHGDQNNDDVEICYSDTNPRAGSRYISIEDGVMDQQEDRDLSCRMWD